MNRDMRAIKKHRWNETEDEVLKALVEENGPKNWNTLAQSIPGRNGKQCRERWTIFLDPGLSRDEWTPGEDEILIECEKEYGHKWAFFVKHLPKRSCVSIRNRWTHLLRVREKEADANEVGRLSMPHRIPEISREINRGLPETVGFSEGAKRNAVQTEDNPVPPVNHVTIQDRTRICPDEAVFYDLFKDPASFYDLF
jgi:hypothetical protein